MKGECPQLWQLCEARIGRVTEPKKLANVRQQRQKYESFFDNSLF